jgi:hypothetical protein
MAAVSGIALTVDGVPARGRVLLGQLFVFWKGHQAFLPHSFKPGVNDVPLPGEPALGQWPDAFWVQVASFDGANLTSADLAAQGFKIVETK